MKYFTSQLGILLILSIKGTVCLETRGQGVNIVKHHNQASGDGLYIEPTMTKAAAAGLKRDLTFGGSIVGNVYAQPLYIENGPSGKAMVIAVTESDNVYALDAADGSIIWQAHVGTPVQLGNLPCGDIGPLGITGTPVVDLPSRTLFFDAMTTPDNGATKKHLIFALNVDTGTTKSGWPVDLDATARFGNTVFTSVSQNQRGALAVVGGIVYAGYGGHAGDCGTYYGWLVGVPINNPSGVLAWATGIRGGGIWAVGGVVSDGTNPYIVTGNTFGAGVWSGGEAVIRFQPGPVFSGQAKDYWAPANWSSLDSSDTDLGGSGALLVDVPGATPSKLVIALGKDGNAYLLDRTTLGGIAAPLASAHVSSSLIIQAAATYSSGSGTHVVFRTTTSGNLTSLRITPTAPPTITTAWTAAQNGRGSPFVTSTDGANNQIVWAVGAEGDQRLQGFDGETGAVIFSGGGSNELMSGTRRFNTGIAARGRIYIANDNRVYAFTLPGGGVTITTQPQSQTVSMGGTAQFTVTATGTAPMGYQWRFNGTALTGATSTSLVLNNVQPAQGGNYTVVVTDSSSSVTSAVAVLTVTVPPTITAQPQSRTNMTGTTASFSTTASGSTPMSYQWRLNMANLANGGRISGATTGTLTISNVQPTDAGSYTLVVTNVAGTTTSAAASLTVVGPPVIITPPASQTTVAGANVNFTVTASGSQPLHYQWRFNGSDLAGATATSLMLNNVQPANGGNYAVVVTNSAGSATSAVAVLTVLVPPAITTQPQNRTNTIGTTASFNALASGSTPLAYQWRLNGGNLVNGGRLNGVTTGSLTISNVQPSDAGSYTLLVTNGAGTVTSAAAALTVNGPPVITSPPVSQTVVVGANVNFSISVSGTPPLAFQWRINETDLGDADEISGSHSSTLTVSNVQPADAGNYTVVVTNMAGAVTSSVATLTVTTPGSCISAPANIVGWWPGDGGANDITGTNNGTLQGGAGVTAPGLDGLAFSFDGTNSFVQISDSPTLKPANLTIEAWVLFTALNSWVSGAPVGDQYIVFKQNTRGGNFEGYDLGKTRVGGGDVFRFIVTSAAGQSVELHSTTVLSTGVWYHVAGVRGSNFTQIYVNGGLEAQAAVSFPQDYGAHPLYFGTSGYAAWDGRLQGRLDEVSLYNRALSATEISDIYSADASGKCKTGATPIVLDHPVMLEDGSFQFTFSNTEGKAFTAFYTTNLTMPFINWFRLGAITEISPGQFQLTDPQAVSNSQRFYRVSSP